MPQVEFRNRKSYYRFLLFLIGLFGCSWAYASQLQAGDILIRGASHDPRVVIISAPSDSDRIQFHTCLEPKKLTIPKLQDCKPLAAGRSIKSSDLLAKLQAKHPDLNDRVYAAFVQAKAGFVAGVKFVLAGKIVGLALLNISGSDFIFSSSIGVDICAIALHTVAGAINGARQGASASNPACYQDLLAAFEAATQSPEKTFVVHQKKDMNLPAIAEYIESLFR